MKNRKKILVAFMLVACMVVGVGYAALTNTLDIAGTGNVNASDAEKAFNQDIYFEGVVVNNSIKAGGVVEADNLPYTANINTNNNDKAQFTVTGLHGQGDTTTITFRIVNNGDLEAKLFVKSCTNSSDDFFEVKYYIGENEINVGNTATSFYTVAAKSGETPTTVDIKVVVTLLQTPSAAVSTTTTFEFNAVSEDNV